MLVFKNLDLYFYSHFLFIFWRAVREDGSPFWNMKQCPACGIALEHAAFYLSRTSPDGLQSYCKLCQRRYREKHPTKEWKRNKERATSFFNMDMHTDCRSCPDTHMGINGLFCELLNTYVEHQNYPPCKRKDA